MSEPVQGTDGREITPAVAAAIRDILAAFEADSSRAHGMGEPVGHGTIRLHGRPLAPPVVAPLDPRADIVAANA
jgi:hypothetical protein